MWTRLMRSAQKANQVLRTEGLGALIAKSFLHLTRIVYTDDTYLVSEHTLEHTDFGDLAPKGTEVDLKVICSLAELASLSAEGYDLSRLDVHRARMHLSRQGMLFCVFIHGRVAHQSWVTMNRDTDIDPIASHVNYQGCAYIGACQTWPEYRGLGLYSYTLSEICKVLKANGLSKAMLTIAPDNRSSIAGVSKAGFRQEGKGRLVRFLLWSDWRLEDESQEKHGRGSADR